MNILFKDSELLDLIEKVEKGQRLDAEAGIRLFASNDLLAIGYMADLVRCRKHGDRTYFSVDKEQQPDSLTHATMMYGHEETYQELVDQLMCLREAQDRTGEFVSVVPCAYCPSSIGGSAAGVSSSTGYEDLKVLAISRLMLDNFDHIKARWVQIGPKLAQVSMAFGVDHLDGAIVEAKSIQDSDSMGQVLTKAQVLQMIRAAGKIPVECDSLYTSISTEF